MHGWVMRAGPSVDRAALKKVVNFDRMTARLDAIARTGPEDDASRVIRDFRLGLKASWPFASEEDDGA